MTVANLQAPWMVAAPLQNPKSHGLGFRVEGLGFRVQGLGFRV